MVAVNRKSSSPVRLVIGTVLFSLLAVSGIFGLQAYSGRAAVATPTLKPSAVAVLPEATASSTQVALPETSTPVPSITLTASPGPSPTASRTPKDTSTPSPTPTPTPSPTSQPQIAPGVYIDDAGALLNGSATPPTAIPTAVTPFQMPPGTTNVLLMGNDTPTSGPARSDTLIIVSINRETGTASMISLPRDLYVYIPGWTMNRINTALPFNGAQSLKETILYNFGVPIHYYAMVDFNGFEQIVNTIGGVEVAVSCRLQDWRIRSPELDVNVEENWEQFALEPGVYQMDGNLALWYARSRLSSSDFDRGRRQQQLLRAMFNKALDLNLLPQVPSLYETYQETVETDMDIGRILQLAALAPTVRNNGIQHLYLAGKTQPWIVPETGAQVQLPIWEGPGMMKETFERLFQPPALNQGSRPPVYVEVINGTSNPDLGRLAADNLAWYGFAPVLGPADTLDHQETTITFYGETTRGTYPWLLSWVVGMHESQIQLVSGASAAGYSYQIVLGEDYSPCVNAMYAPLP